MFSRAEEILYSMLTYRLSQDEGYMTDIYTNNRESVKCKIYLGASATQGINGNREVI